MPEKIIEVAEEIGTVVEGKINEIKAERIRTAENEKKKKETELQEKEKHELYIEETKNALRKIAEKMNEGDLMTWGPKDFEEIEKYFSISIQDEKVLVAVFERVGREITVDEIDEIIEAKIIRDRLEWIKGREPTSIYIS